MLFLKPAINFIKKSILFIFILSILILPFEQMVFAAEFSSPIKKSDSLSINNNLDSDLTVKKTLTKKTVLNQINNHPSTLLKPSALPATQLSVMADDSLGGLTSNANNFHEAWSASVDQRTGNASFSLTVASILHDDGRARRDLTLSYGGSPTARKRDIFGLGPQWRFNVGTEQASSAIVPGRRTTDIATNDGQRFTMVRGQNDQGTAMWHPLHYKLGNVAFSGGPGNWNVFKATDIREYIADGYTQWEQTRDGRKLYFYYDKNGAGENTKRLTYICEHQLTIKEQQGLHNACAGNGIWITYAGRSITIHGTQDITLHKGESGGVSNIDSVTMPPLSSEGTSGSMKKSMIYFSYDSKGRRPWLLSRVSYPTGKSKTFLYNDQSSHSDAQFKGLPIGISINSTRIPVVTEMVTTSEQTGVTPPQALKEWYHYGAVDGHGQLHNYMGYQGYGSVVPGRDNLFDRPDDYTYSVSRDNGLTTTTTTYNKYHLAQRVEQRDNQRKNLLAQNIRKYIPLKGTTFSQLPGNYSLPIGNDKTLYATTETGQDKTVSPVRVMQTARYNNNGQKLWEQDAYGRITMTQYCPPEGNEHCPAADSRWPKTAKPEKIVMIPARPSPGGNSPFLMMAATEYTDPEPAVITVFDYIALPAVTRNKKKPGSYTRVNSLIQTGDNDHFWQVKTKTAGTLPLSVTAHLQPGDPLPELSGGKASTQTSYQYNTQTDSDNYGQINQVSITKYNSATPVIKGNALLMTAVPSPAMPMEKITFKVHHEIDKSTQTRRTTTVVTSDLSTMQTVKSLYEMQKSNIQNNAISLGTTVYSLKTGEKTASHDTLKEMETQWYYDHWRRPVKQIITPTSGGKAQEKKWQYIFGAQGNAVIETLPDGQQFKKVFNSFNQLITTSHRFADQAEKSIEDQASWIPDSYIVYTDTGQIASKTVYHADDPASDASPGGTIGLTTTYGYDTLNREVWKKTPDSNVAVTVRNDPAMQVLHYKVTKEGPGPLLSIVESNVLGKPVARYLLPLNPAFKRQGAKNDNLLYSQDLQTRLQQIINNLQPASTLQTLNNYGLLPLSGSNGLFNFVKLALKQRAWLTHTTWQYDGNGRKIEQRQGNGAVTRWVYQQGNLVATITPDGHTVHDTFNVLGKKVSRCIQPAGSKLCHVLGTRGYDAQGNILWQADEYGQKLRYTRDNNGRILSMKTPATTEAPAGHTFTYEYSSLGMTKASVDGHPYVTHRYDPGSWQLTDTNDTISHLHYTYDKNTGALIKITRSAPLEEAGIMPLAEMNYPTTVQRIAQDRYLKPLSITDEAGNKYTSVHDRIGRVIQVKVQTGTIDGQINGQQKQAAALSITLNSITYDALSRPVTTTDGQGMQRLFSYDSTGKLASTTDTRHGRELLQLSYTYDADTNNILTLTRKEGSLAAIQHYTYDLQNNLSAFHCSAVNVSENYNSRTGRNSLDLCPRDIDLKGSGLTEPPIITDQQYTFDQWNNISRVVQSVSTDKGTIKKTTNYVYATKGAAMHPNAYDPNRLLSYQSRWEGQLYSEAPAGLTYDNAGRIIKDMDGNLLHYNMFGQQDKFINAGTKEVTIYTHDSTEHKMATQSFNAENRPLQAPMYLLYNGNTITAKAQRGKDDRLHISAEIGGIAHSEDGIITRWYLQNYKGDVLQSVNSQGESLSNNVYSPYGMQYDRQNNAMEGLPQPLKNQSPRWQSHLPGFDGQVTDEATGYQFLGGGYRAYNPVCRQFMARDSFTPFKKINGYSFADNNPVLNTDPTGHSAWLGYLMGSIFVAAAIPALIGGPIAVFCDFVGPGVAALLGAALGFGIASCYFLKAADAKPAKTQPEPESISKNYGISQGINAITPADTMNTEDSTADTAGTMTGLTASEIIASGAAGSAAGARGDAASDMSKTRAFDSKLAAKSGMQSAVRSLDTISRGLMAASMASGLASTGLNTGNIRKGRNTIIEKNETSSTGITSEHGAENINKSNTGQLTNKYSREMNSEQIDASDNGPAVDRINRWVTETANEVGMLNSIPESKNKLFQTRISEITALHARGHNFK